MFVWRNAGNLYYLEIEEFKKYGIEAYFTSRLGGVSQGPYSSLNLGLHTSDNQERVLTNRQLVADTLGFDYQNVVAGEQVHSNLVYTVSKKDIGRGALNYQDSIPGVDALITEESGIPLISFYADCVPLYILEPEKGIFGLAHAGWKGTVQKIAMNTVWEMQRTYGVDPENLWVAIGPSISKDFYEVDERVIKVFKENFTNYLDFVSGRGKERFLLDLQTANVSIFEEAGVNPRKIIKSGFCTYRDNEFFYSYRKEQGITGRMASIIYKK